MSGPGRTQPYLVEVQDQPLLGASAARVDAEQEAQLRALGYLGD